MRVLFMCVANSARSQLAEAIARHLCQAPIEFASAGSLPTRVNPLALEVLAEMGIPSHGAYSKSVQDLPQVFLSRLDLVITLCAEEVCPYLGSTVRHLHWPLPDPAGEQGTPEEKRARFRQTAAELQQRLNQYLSQLAQPQ